MTVGQVHFIRRVNKDSVYGITPRNAEQSFAVHALLNPDIKLVTISGKAGTGKTLLALAVALETRSKYRQILLTRPVMPTMNRLRCWRRISSPISPTGNSWSPVSTSIAARSPSVPSA